MTAAAQTRLARNHVVIPADETPPSAFVVDPAHLTVKALTDVRAFMDAAHAEHLAEVAQRAADA
jgi:hypothetical protein